MDKTQANDRIKQHVEGLGGTMLPLGSSDYIPIPEGFVKNGDISYQRLTLMGFADAESALTEYVHTIKAHISRVHKRLDPAKRQKLFFGWRGPAYEAASANAMNTENGILASSMYVCVNLTAK